MKFALWDGKEFGFELSAREKDILLDLLGHYPLIPAAAHRLTGRRSRGRKQPDQALLEEALAAQRRENKAQLAVLLADPTRFRVEKGRHLLFLTPPQMEWLLQVLNDVRVGSWMILGEPDEKKGKPARLDEANAQYHWVMDGAGYFQMSLLDALHGSIPPRQNREQPPP